MVDDFRIKTELLRNEAWEAVVASSQYAAFKALDAAVVAIGGHTHLNLPRAQSETLGSWDPRMIGMLGVRTAGRARVTNSAAEMTSATSTGQARKLSQGDAAEIALIRAEKPLAAAELMQKAIDEGAAVGGQNPLVNFTSSLSKDNRLYSFRKDGGYFWWLRNVALPSSWNETEPDEFDGLLGSASSVNTNQEGGDGHGTATN